MRAAAALVAVAVGLAACGGDDASDAGEAADAAPATTAPLPRAVDELFRRFEAINERPGFYDDVNRSLAELRPGDRALYVLWAVDGEINNGGFSQYLSNSTAELHDEAVASAEGIGAKKTAALLRRLPRVLGVARVSADRDERQRLLDGLTDEQLAELRRLDEEWYAGISAEIEAGLVEYLRAHPEAFSPQ